MKSLVFSFMLLFICLGCRVANQTSLATKEDNDERCILPTLPACYGVNDGKPFENALELKGGIFGRVAVRAEIDTVNLKLSTFRILKTYLKKASDSSAYAAYQNVEFLNEPNYPNDLLVILPQIIQYLDTVRVTKSSSKECEMPSSYTLFVRIQ
ncbi:hypothetical protein [Rufibacter sp. LB8]|uniref:hypothetical protein n=1 Tax=Rufibacter sp. LB8 TaxID=2777781 RepID=UPI00178C510E|nr:hypothetical protein [Rufibacter sp. LB8]